MRIHRAFAVLAMCLCAQAQSGAPWTLAKTPHFEVYAQSGAPAARSTSLWLEQLRALFVQETGLKLERAAPVRVIAFRSAEEYDPYRLRVASDAYYVAFGQREWIVLSSGAPRAFGVAAHEYAHSLLRAAGLKLPPWMSEGLSEFFSTVRVGARGSSIGGDLPARSQALRQMSWMPLADLLREERGHSTLFYAQSWAITDMLLFSPDYAPKFTRLVALLVSGQGGAQAMPSLYGRSLETIARDARAWVQGRRFHAMALGGVAPAAVSVEVSPVAEFGARMLMADLLAAIGEWDRAEAQYRNLAREAPRNAEVPAALGAIALHRGDREGARREWKRAMDLGVSDAGLCYQYAVLASLAGLPGGEVQRAYERAIELQPDFDDARYALALIEKNSEHYEAALTQLRAMRKVDTARQFHYWYAMADALTQLGRREEAVNAAKEAAQHASSPEEHALAAGMAHIAQTDLGVRFVRDANGRSQLVTTRMPHDAAAWNPFIEPGDDVRRAAGTLREIDCGEPVTRFLVETGSGLVTLAIPDLSHLQAQNAPPEFTCGAQSGIPVTVVYAAGPVPQTKADGVLRGIEFR